RAPALHHWAFFAVTTDTLAGVLTPSTVCTTTAGGVVAGPAAGAELSPPQAARARVVRTAAASAAPWGSRSMRTSGFVRVDKWGDCGLPAAQAVRDDGLAVNRRAARRLERYAHAGVTSWA